MELLPLEGFVVGVTADQRLEEQVTLLGRRGARVMVGPSIPADTGPAWRLIEAACDRRLDAVTFTTPPALRNLFAIAAQRGADDLLLQALNGSVVTVCQSAECAEAAVAMGVIDAVVATRARLGSVVHALIARLGATRRTLIVEGMPVVVQGRALLIGDERAGLSDREHAVFQALMKKPGAVVPRALLLRSWGASDGDGRVVDATVARLRQRLGPAAGAVVSVPRRGYRLDVDEAQAS